MPWQETRNYVPHSGWKIAIHVLPQSKAAGAFVDLANSTSQMEDATVDDAETFAGGNPLAELRRLTQQC